MPSSRLPETLYEQIAREAAFQCGYCRAPQEVLPYRLEVEHLLPRSLGGSDDRPNLWLSCHKCNKVRSNRIELADPLSGKNVPIFKPRFDNWQEHFTWELNGRRIIGLTARGRATVEGLRLNDEYHQAARTIWILAKRYPPK